MNKYIFYIAVILIISSILTFFIIYHKKNEHFQNYCPDDDNTHADDIKCYGWHDTRSTGGLQGQNTKDYGNPSFCKKPADLGQKWKRINIVASTSSSSNEGTIDVSDQLTVADTTYTRIADDRLPNFISILSQYKLAVHMFTRYERGGDFEDSLIGGISGATLDGEWTTANSPDPITYNNYILLSDDPSVAYIPIPVDTQMFCIIRQLICYILDGRCTINDLEAAAVEANQLKLGLESAATTLGAQITTALNGLTNKDGGTVSVTTVTELRTAYDTLLSDYGALNQLKITLDDRIDGSDRTGTSSGYVFEIANLEQQVRELGAALEALDSGGGGDFSAAALAAALGDQPTASSPPPAATPPPPAAATPPPPPAEADAEACVAGDHPALQCNDEIEKIKAMYAKEKQSTYRASSPNWVGTLAWDPIAEEGKNIDLLIDRKTGYKMIDDTSDQRFNALILSGPAQQPEGMWHSRSGEPIVITDESDNKCTIEYPWESGVGHFVGQGAAAGVYPVNWQGIGKRKYSFELLRETPDAECTWKPMAYEIVPFSSSDCHENDGDFGGNCNDDIHQHVHYDCDADGANIARTECTAELQWRDDNQGQWDSTADPSDVPGLDWDADVLSGPICKLHQDPFMIERGELLPEGGGMTFTSVPCTSAEEAAAKNCHETSEGIWQKYVEEPVGSDIWTLNSYVDNMCQTLTTT